MNLHKLVFTECDSYKAAKKIVPKGVMVHSTGANNPELRRYVGPDDGLLGKNLYNNHWNMPNVGKSVHAFIGKLKDGSVATYQVLPWEYKSGHCYKGKNGSGNDTHLSFEICEDGLDDPVYFGKVYQEAVELTAMLCEKFNLDPMADGVVICHYEGYFRGIASNHGDVLHWFPKHGKSMDTFRADVNKLLAKEPVKQENKTLYRVQVGAYRLKKNADAQLAKVEAAGFDTYMVIADGLYKIQVGAYSKRENADAMLTKLNKAGFAAFITTVAGSPVTNERKIEVGSTVRVKPGAKDYNDGGLASYVYDWDLIVTEISGNRVVVTHNGVVIAAVHKDNLILV